MEYVDSVADPPLNRRHAETAAGDGWAGVAFIVMKIVRHLLGWCVVLGSIAGVLWGSFQLRERFGSGEHEDHEEAAKAEGENDKAESEGLHLDEEARKRIGLSTVELKEVKWQPQARAYGEVLSTLSLQDLEGEITIAESVVATSKRALDRARTLKTAGDLPEKDFDSAEAQNRESELKLLSLKRRLAAEWGEAGKAPMASTTVLMRVEMPVSGPPANLTRVAGLMVAGNELRADKAALFSAPTQDAKTQMPAWIVRVEGVAKAPAVGAAVTAMLSSEGEPETGVLIPADAVLHFNGLAWVFVEEKHGEYERRAVTLDRPLADGWFVKGGLEAGDHVVTTGAVNLLAAENKSLLGEKE